MDDLRRLLGYLRPHWGIFFLATCAMLIVGVLESAIGALIVPIFDQAFAQGAGQRTATLFGLERIIPNSGLAAWKTISILLLVFTLAKGFAEYFSTYLMARIGQSAVLKLRQDLYRHVLSQSASFFERHRTNYLVSRLVSSAAAIETAVTSTLRDMLRESFTLLAFLGASFFYSWRLTLGSLLLAPLVAMLTARFGTRLRNLARDSFEGSKQLTDTAQEALSNVLRHAGAESVWIRLSVAEGVLEAEIEDDGVGFDPAEVATPAASGRGLGILGMRERLDLVSGSVAVESSPGAGTRVLMRVPLGKEAPVAR